MRLAFLFGAGASKGSENEKKYQPPLGSELFDALRVFNPNGWGKKPKLINIDEKDFEQTMKHLIQTLPKDDLIELLFQLKLYFYQFEPSSKSLYCQLISNLLPFLANIAFVTLNYERLLELALLKLGIQPVCDRTPNSNEVEICYPHGCCHFGIEGIHGPPGSIIFDPTDNVIDGPVIVHRNYQELSDNPLSAVTSCIVPDKITPIGKKFIDEQRNRCGELITTAELVIIIGIRVREHDKHLWEFLANTNAKIIFCGGKTSGIEFNAWHRMNRPEKSYDILPGKFQDHFEDICELVNDFFQQNQRFLIKK